MIHYDIPKPEISLAFTVNDIHKIREWHYAQLKVATREEKLNYYNKSATTVSQLSRKGASHDQQK
jgi:hypothetical protein